MGWFLARRLISFIREPQNGAVKLSFTHFTPPTASTTSEQYSCALFARACPVSFTRCLCERTRTSVNAVVSLAHPLLWCGRWRRSFTHIPGLYAHVCVCRSTYYNSRRMCESSAIEHTNIQAHTHTHTLAHARVRSGSVVMEDYSVACPTAPLRFGFSNLYFLFDQVLAMTPRQVIYFCPHSIKPSSSHCKA